MMNVIEIEDPNQKSQICERVLRSLPDWFGIESAIVNYINDVQTMETWAAIEEEEIAGCLSLNKHNSSTAEIHVMGVMPYQHRKGIGLQLIEMAEKSLSNQGFTFLTVKTLSESRPCEAYAKTRAFYLAAGFLPLEEFKTLWGEANPCLMLCKAILPH